MIRQRKHPLGDTVVPFLHPAIYLVYKKQHYTESTKIPSALGRGATTTFVAVSFCIVPPKKQLN